MHGLPLVHRASILGAAATRSGGAAKGRRLWRVDDVNDKTGRIQPARIDRQRIAGVHAKRCGVDDDLELLWIGRANSRCATGCGGDGPGEVLGATLVDIEYGE